MENELDDFVAWFSAQDRFDGFCRGDLDNNCDEERQAWNEYDESKAFLPCEICNGAQENVRGNCNIINGKRVCDYCHAKNNIFAARHDMFATRHEGGREPK